ncbi:hypothetical protein KY290_027548 [Solanum tuberosum]|uniref:Retrotransposon gag domain-containing protein n=1 Tax=Solanum tuberosum TaxID=4113 RepID=A0ABQ7UFB2_SOLTU|nr:hypothetical protein KY285_026486 [Solanum tuberosum]KAH0748316.1 hypothetical protein KY290_027548 [Solanum tuberosum]
MAGGNAKLQERVTRLEALIVTTDDGEDLVDLVTQIYGVNAELALVSKSLNEKFGMLEAEYAAKHEIAEMEMEVIRKEKEDLCGEVLLLRRGLQGTINPIRMKVPKPKAYNGVRSAKELENFLWDVENYFKEAKVPNSEKVSVTTMYLSDAAKVWWRTRVAEVESANLPQIETWEMLKKELKTQFLPSNSSWVARDGLRQLKQSSTVRVYIKEFLCLMLNIGNMVEEDKLYYFMSGLKGWAHRELRRQNVQTLNFAIVAADKLADFDEGDDPRDTLHFKQKDKGKEWKKNGKGHAAEKEDEGGKTRQGEFSFPKQKGKFGGCFSCGGPHLKRDCPVQVKVNALIAAELERERNNEAKTSNVNSLALVEDEDDGQKMGFVWDPNRFR